MKLPFANYVKAHHISHAALSVGAVVAALVFFVVGAGIRLLIGPVSLGPLQSTLAGAIQGALPGISLKYDEAAIEWSRDRGRINLVVLGARMFDDKGRIVARAPKADIDLAAAPFLHGDIVVQRITLVGVQLGLVHMKDGGVRLGVVGDGGTEDIIAKLNTIIDAKGPSSLKSFAVRNARLTLADESTGLSLLAPRAALILTARKDGIATQLDADVSVSGRPAHIKASMVLPPVRAPIDVDATVTGLDLRGLGANAAMFRALKAIALSVDVTANFTMAPGARLTRAVFDLSASGALPVASMKDKAVHVQKLSLHGAYDGTKRHLSVVDGSLDAREASGKFNAGADFTYDTADVLQGITGSFGASKIALNMPGFTAEAMTLQSVQAEAQYKVAEHQLEIGKLAVTAPALNLQASGTVTLPPPGQTPAQSPAIAISGRLAALPVRTLLHYWPLAVQSAPREWIASSIFAGEIGPLVFETHFAAGDLDQPILPEQSLKLSFAMNDVEASYVDGLTHATGLVGTGILTGDTFAANFERGNVGAITISQGKGVIPNLHQTGTIGQINLHADGQMGDIMTLIDMKPLNYPTRFGVDPKTTRGQASVDLAFKVPMLHDLSVDAVGISVKAAVSDFAVTLGKATRITNGAVNFDIDNSRLHQTGTVMLADARLAVDWTEDFKTTQPITTRLNVKGPLTQNARAMLNIGLATILTGVIPMSADIQGNRGRLRTVDAAIDLTQATIAIPILNLGKPGGTSATGRVLVNFAGGDLISDETIRITGPNLSANGRATFDAKGQFQQMNFPSVKMGAMNDLSFVLTHSAAGDDYVLRGRSLDGSFIGRNGSADAPGRNASARPASEDEMAGPFHIDAKLDRLAMRDGVAIAPFNLDLSGVGSRPGTLTLAGTLVSNVAGAKPASITGGIDEVGGARKLTIKAADAGVLMRGLFAFESMRGGMLTLNASLPGRATDVTPPGNAPDYTGLLTIENFGMVNQPLLTRLFSAGSLTGVGDLMGSDGISLEVLRMPFSSKNNVISVDDARARGRAIGATADGYIDRPKNQLALKGSLVPAYGLNSFLGNVPVLGDLLVSKQGEGVFGITYSATGNADQPEISVNPLSVLTPGILRRIFEGHIPNASNAPSNAPGANAEAKAVEKPAATPN